jgi:hypothetical protein
MNFEDESYVRLYTKRTTTNRRLNWEGRAVMHELMYEVDRAGVFDPGSEPLEDALELVTGLPQEVVQLGLARLLKTGTLVVRDDGKLVWPRFLEAQTAKRSDRLRSLESRARRRDGVGPDSRDDGHETPVSRDAASRPVSPESRLVSPGHDSSRPSQIVTLSCSDLDSADPSLAVVGEAPPASVEDPEPEPEDRETCCPFPEDLVARAERVGIVEQCAKAYRVTEDVIRHHVTETGVYWTAGRGSGRRRKNWMQVVRGRLQDLHKSGGLTMPMVDADEAKRLARTRELEDQKAERKAERLAKAQDRIAAMTEAGEELPTIESLTGGIGH